MPRRTARKQERVIFREGPYTLVQLPGRSLTIAATLSGKRYRISTRTDDERVALQKLRDFIFEHEGAWRIGRANTPTDWRAIAKALTSRQRDAAKARGHAFLITAPYVYGLMAESGFRCSISGVPFTIGSGELDVHPWAPSIDRIDNRHGYLPDNVRVVCIVANIAMNRWGYDTLLRLARGIVRSSVVTAEEPTLHRPPSLSSVA